MSKAGPLEIEINGVEGKLVALFSDDENFSMAKIGNLRLDTDGIDFFHLHGDSHREVNFQPISDGYKALFCPQCGLRIVFPKLVVNFTDLRLFLKKQNQKSGG